MDKKTIALVIVVCAVVISIGIFAGRFIIPTETPVPTPKPIHRATPSSAPASSFEIEYPVTAYFEKPSGSTLQVTLYEDGTAFGKFADDRLYGNDTVYGKWEIREKTISKIKYRFEFGDTTRGGRMYFELFSNHDAISGPRADNTFGYWR